MRAGESTFSLMPFATNLSFLLLPQRICISNRTAVVLVFRHCVRSLYAQGMGILFKCLKSMCPYRFSCTVEIVYNETGYNEQPDITSRFGAEVRSRRYTYMIIAISVITRTGYNEQTRLDLGARYIRFLLYFCFKLFKRKKTIVYKIQFLELRTF